MPAMLNFLKIYRTEQNFTGHVLLISETLTLTLLITFYKMKMFTKENTSGTYQSDTSSSLNQTIEYHMYKNISAPKVVNSQNSIFLLITMLHLTITYYYI